MALEAQRSPSAGQFYLRFAILIPTFQVGGIELPDFDTWPRPLLQRRQLQRKRREGKRLSAKADLKISISYRLIVTSTKNLFASPFSPRLLLETPFPHLLVQGNNYLEIHELFLTCFFHRIVAIKFSLIGRIIIPDIHKRTNKPTN